MSDPKSGIVGIYRYLDHFCEAIEKVKNRPDFSGYEALAPTSYHEIEVASGFKPSAVRWFTFWGGMIGTASGFGLTLGLDYDWPLTVGGKMGGFHSIPAYVVIGFELTILLGAISTILGMLVMCKLANPRVKILDKRITDDRFAIFLPNVNASSPQAAFLKECGAEEINAV